jgi:hypothetical protein
VVSVLAPSAAGGYPAAFVQREITLAQVLGWTVALAGSAVALSIAFLQFWADHEGRAALFTAGGLALAVWAASHVTDSDQRA